MARPRKPTHLLVISGQHKRNPARLRARKNEPTDNRPIGQCLPELTAAERKAWREIVDQAVPGVLCRADRIAVESAAKLIAKMRDRTDPSNLSHRELLHQIAGTDFSNPDAIRSMFLDSVDYAGRISAFSASDQSNLRTLLGQLGMCPADRPRIDINKPEPQTNPFADL